MNQAAQVRSAIRKQLSTDNWSWRFYDGNTEVEKKAIETLRSEADKARQWLQLFSEAIGMPLPAGNGIGGPWHRSIVIDSNNYVGLSDIACGRIAWTDAKAPSYVQRFAIKTKNIVSVNMAGGSGGKADSIRQIALTYYMHPKKDVSVKTPKPNVTDIEWGFQTCYGERGEQPTESDWRKEWAALVSSGVEVRETNTPQWDVVVKSMSGKIASAWLRAEGVKHDEDRFASGLRDGQGGIYYLNLGYRRSNLPCAKIRFRECYTVGNVDLELLGAGQTGRYEVALLRAEIQNWLRQEMAQKAAEAIFEIMRDSGHGMLPPVQCASVQSVYDRVYYDVNIKNVRFQRALFDYAKPADPLTRDERNEVRNIVKDLLTQDPKVVGLNLRDPWGRPGYADGANHITYQLPKGTKNWKDIEDEPGVREWHAKVRQSAKEEKDRIASYGRYSDGPVKDDEVATLEKAGYVVTKKEHGRITAVIR